MTCRNVDRMHGSCRFIVGHDLTSRYGRGQDFYYVAEHIKFQKMSKDFSIVVQKEKSEAKGHAPASLARPSRGGAPAT